MAIDIALDHDQQALQRSAADLFRARSPIETVRALEAGDIGYSPELWREMAELHWLGITIPEEHGGNGGSFLDLYPICEEMGRQLVPSPFLDTVGVAGSLITAVGSDAQRSQHLPAIASGEEIVALATIEPNGGFGPDTIKCSARSSSGGWALDGTKLLVPFATSAHTFLVAARTSGDGGADGITVFLVDAAAAGVSVHVLPNIAGGPLGAVQLDDVLVDGASVIGAVDDGWPALSRAITSAAVLQTATIVGAGRAVLDMTSQYAKDRVQFGKPIGSYQAVQYMVSDILIDMHRTDMLARQASFLIATDRPWERAAAIAVAFGKRAAAHIHRQAHEVHAGVAFIVEHDLTLYSRRSKFWENNFGDARYYEEQLASIIC